MIAPRNTIVDEHHPLTPQQFPRMTPGGLQAVFAPLFERLMAMTPEQRTPQHERVVDWYNMMTGSSAPVRTILQATNLSIYNIEHATENCLVCLLGLKEAEPEKPAVKTEPVVSNLARTKKWSRHHIRSVQKEKASKNYYFR